MALRIYISSTYEDLKDFRERVYDNLRRLRHDVIAMEDYVATDSRPLEKCLEDVRTSDVYVGLFAWRYGYVPKKGNPQRRSITELEYLEAKKDRKPLLLFLLNKNAAWPPALTDWSTGENGKGTKIMALRQKLGSDRLVSMFETPDELATKVIAALYQWQTQVSEAASEARSPSTADSSGAQKTARPRKDRPLIWEPGSVLRVRFLAGDVTLRSRVIRLAQIWSAYANIGFVESDVEASEVRVTFEEGSGVSWAYEGTHCLAVPITEPTVNFGSLRAGSPIEEIESTVLHYFGFVLGLAKEHKNPSGAIPWDKKKVYASLTGPPNYWTKETVNTMVFETWAKDRFPFAKPFDPLSIMAWSFPAGFTGGEEILRRNVAISPGDKEFVSRLYPYPSVPVAGIPRQLPARKRRSSSRRRKTK